MFLNKSQFTHELMKNTDRQTDRQTEKTDKQADGRIGHAWTPRMTMRAKLGGTALPMPMKAVWVWVPNL